MNKIYILLLALLVMAGPSDPGPPAIINTPFAFKPASKCSTTP